MEMGKYICSNISSRCAIQLACPNTLSRHFAARLYHSFMCSSTPTSVVLVVVLALFPRGLGTRLVLVPALAEKPALNIGIRGSAR